jgi:hypothetical protein
MLAEWVFQRAAHHRAIQFATPTLISVMAMTSDTRALWCLIEGDSTLFEVTAPVTASIHRLKQLIHEERKNGVLRKVDASDLVLWKVCVL